MPIGGLRMVDNGEADDKVGPHLRLAHKRQGGHCCARACACAQIIAVMENDLIYGRIRDIKVSAAALCSRSRAFVARTCVRSHKLAAASHKLAGLHSPCSACVRVCSGQDLPKEIVNRLTHYFLTYKTPPHAETSSTQARTDLAVESPPDACSPSAPHTQIVEVYGRAEAQAVIRAGMEDYMTHYGNLSKSLGLLRLLATSRL